MLQPNHPEIRDASDADWTAIADLLTASDLPRDGADAHLARFIVAERDERIVGCACVEPYGDAGLLRSVAVAASERGRGVGEALTACAAERAATRGMTALYLLTTTASRFFARLGFVVIARDAALAAVRGSGQFSGGCCSTAVAMRLELPLRRRIGVRS